MPVKWLLRKQVYVDLAEPLLGNVDVITYIQQGADLSLIVMLLNW